MNKKFVIQLCLFCLFSIVIPITYLTIRFNLFQVNSRLQIGLWGIIVIGILVGGLSVLVKFYLEGMKTKYSLLKQILQGIIKLILPLLLVLVILVFLKDNIILVIEALVIIIPCELVAIVINPFPKWCYDNNVDGIAAIADKILRKDDK